MIFGKFRQHLFWQIFGAFILVVGIGLLVLVLAFQLSLPSSFERQSAAVQQLVFGEEPGETETGPHMGQGMRMGTGMGQGMMEELYQLYQTSVSEAMLLSFAVAFGFALIGSWLISRRITAPVRQMTTAAGRIAEGNYSERVPVFHQGENVNELDQLALEFNQMAQGLEKTELMRRQLIGDVSHELRTPLTTIKGYAEGLMDNVLPAEPQTYQQIYQEADRLTRLVEDLQELSRIEGGAYQLEPRVTDLIALIRSTAERIRMQFADKHVDLVLELPDQLPTLQVDEDRIRQVLVNLTGNALQYTPAEGTVTISAGLTGNEIQVNIHDTGIGIAPDHLPHLFTRFFRADKSRSRASGGSGIGLTISKHLIEAHGGRIWAESPGPDLGSTFTFALPLV
jgi:histidine kinase